MFGVKNVRWERNNEQEQRVTAFQPATFGLCLRERQQAQQKASRRDDTWLDCPLKLGSEISSTLRSGS